MPDKKPKEKEPFRACIPLEERPRNDVDIYLKTIEEIQGCCNHDFRFLEPPDIRESKAKGVFIIYQADWRQLTELKEVKLRCLHCSLQKTWDPQLVCFKCLYEGKFEKGAFRKFLRSIYEKWVIPARIEQYEEKLIGDCDEYLAQAKAFLALEGKR